MAWVHIPSNITSALHQESEGSTSELNLEAMEVLSQSAMLKSKHRQLQYWQHVWQTEPYLKLLSGMTCTPSMVQHGVDSWMESLADIRANRSVVQEEEKDSKIQKTSGQESNNSSLKSDQDGVSLRMWKDIFDSAISIQSNQDLEGLAIELKNKSVQRLISEHLINEGDFLFSLWPTPVADGDRSIPFAWGNLPLGVKARRFHHHQMQLKSGETLSKEDQTLHLQLNPRFVEWLMGLPEGWVSQNEIN